MTVLCSPSKSRSNSWSRIFMHNRLLEQGLVIADMPGNFFTPRIGPNTLTLTNIRDKGFPT